MSQFRASLLKAKLPSNSESNSLPAFRLKGRPCLDAAIAEQTANDALLKMPVELEFRIGDGVISARELLVVVDE